MAKKTEILSFEEAWDFARSLKFKKQKEWRNWAKTNARPKNIPAYPDERYANEGWISWPDFLGYDRVANQNRKYRPFKEAREYARSLGFTKGKWEEWAKTNARPNDIPSSAWKTYAKEWKGWGDFLGTGNIAPKNRKYRSFEKARKFARSLDFKKMEDWYKWVKTDARPQDIPANPGQHYKDKGWIGMPDFLGTGIVATQNRKYKPFEEARKFAQSLGLKNKEEWKKWIKTSARSQDIPARPDHVYKKDAGWISMPDFLGYDRIANQNRKFRQFKKAQEFVKSLALKNQKEWRIFARSEKRPPDIPANPDQHYKDTGWISFPDFLGIDRIATQNRKYRPFEKAREFARTLGFKKKEEWVNFAKTKDKPKDIPSNPFGVYKNEWGGWNDWLGCNNGWNVENIRNFVYSILPYLDTFTPAGLYVLLQQNGLLDIDKSSKGKSFIQALKTGKFPKNELEKFVNKEESLVDEFLVNPKFSLESENLKNAETCLSEMDIVEEDFNFITVDTKAILAACNEKLYSTMDREAVDFLRKEAVARIWYHAYSNENDSIEQLDRYNNANMYAEEVKKLFLNEYDGAKNLQIPDGYSFKIDGTVCPPNLMQRHAAYLVHARRRIGNWSGTGAGKTLSAVLASRVIDAKITIICCPNSVVNGWAKSIKAIYPDSIIEMKNLKIKLQSNKHNYLILNYEIFQQTNAEFKIKQLLTGIKVDFVVVDEIHFSKQRVVEDISKRKQVIAAMLSEIASVNENLHVLGMSATPVINNLFEGKSLIELITGFHHDDLNTDSRYIGNCVALYQKLISNGIRWLPQYKQRIDVKTIEVDCGAFLEEIKQTNKKNYLDLEAILTKAKIPEILTNLKPKTIVYTHYLDDILEPLKNAIENAGWKTAVYSGDDKTGLDAFLNRDADVLIGTRCISTGVDGLQEVCNRIIINSLPWTHAEFEQLKGRIYRQGQKSEHVDIIVPLTYASVNGERWSWCDSRWNRIKFKKSIADAAVDGIIPEGHLRTPAQAFNDVMKWLERLENGEVHEIERRKIDLKLSDEQQKIGLRKFGDFSQMNHRLNVSSSSKTHENFTKNPEQFEYYHSMYREARKEWQVIPYQEAIKWCKARPDLIIGDFGCGEAFLSKELGNKVCSFDHVAVNEYVEACDMAHVSLEDEFLDAAIFSLSLMGTNYIDYLREAHRCLKLDGHLWIAEPTSRIKDIALFKNLLYLLGFDVIGNESVRSKFTFIKALKTDRMINEIALQKIVGTLILE